VRFNFRGVGQSAGAFDEGIGETEDAMAALAPRTQGIRRIAAARARRVLVRHIRSDARRAARDTASHGARRPGRQAVRRSGNVPPDTIVIHGEEDEVVPLADVFAVGAAAGAAGRRCFPAARTSSTVGCRNCNA
jgi:alpha/beta superfamily hydrolase